MLALKQKPRLLGDKFSAASVKGKQASTHLGTFFFALGGESGATGQGRRCQEVFSLCGPTGKVWTLCY